MANPLDHAMGKVDREQRLEAERRQRALDDEASRRHAFNDLMADFLARMNAVGNPGVVEVKQGRFKKIRAWYLMTRGDGDGQTFLMVTTDGLVPHDAWVGGRHDISLVPYTEWGTVLDKYGLDRVTESMAELLLRARPT